MIYGLVPIWVLVDMMPKNGVLLITIQEMGCRAMSLHTELSIKIRKDGFISVASMVLHISLRRV